VASTLHAGLLLERARLAERWQRSITRTAAVPYSAAEIGTRLLELVDKVLLALATDDSAASAAQIGQSLVGIGYRSPDALSATLELFSTFVLENAESDQFAHMSRRLPRLLGGIAAGFDSAARRQLLDDQEASRAAVLAENRRTWDALRRQAALLDLAPDAILVREVGSARILFWNHGAEALYGWSRDEALDQPSHLLLQTESAELLERIEASVFQDGHWEGELVHKRRDGTRLVVSSRWAAQWHADGRPLACLEINTDITARKQMEADLREREANLERAQTLAHLGSWEWNLATDAHYWSPEAVRLLGYQVGEIETSQQALFRAIHPDDHQRVRDALADARENISYDLEIRTAGLDGVDRVLLCQNELIRDARGHPLKLVGTVLDVTERKRAEAERVQLSAMQAARSEAEAARQRVAFLADASRVLASSLDLDATLQNVVAVAVPALADRCVLHMLREDGDLSRADETRQPARSTSFEPDPDELQRVVASGEAHLTSRMMLVPLLSRDRAYGVVSYLAGPGRAPYSETEMGLAEDLARRCDLAIDNARLHAEAQRATRLRDEFLSVAAHELKTPMTTLRGYAQWLLRPLKDGRTAEPVALERGLRAIDVQSAKLVDLTAQLLDISRIEAGKLQLQCREVNVSELVRSMVAAAQATTQKHTLTLDAPARVRAAVDPLRLEQVIGNLIDNAVKYSPDGGAIDVEVRPTGRGRLRISVRDRGLGIPVERRENLFDRFYQAHGEGHFGGLGLGLYISRQIVELHGGEISAEFPADGGSHFIVSLPIKQPSRRRRSRTAPGVAGD
jgi:PAS domain S-box-containing protein